MLSQPRSQEQSLSYSSSWWIGRVEDGGRDQFDPFPSEPRRLEANMPAKVMIAATMNALPIPVTKPTDSMAVNEM